MRSILTFAIIWMCCAAYAQDAEKADERGVIPTLTTLDGKTYNKAKLQRRTGDSIIILFLEGDVWKMVRTHMDNLPDDARSTWRLPSREQIEADKKRQEEIDLARKKKQEALELVRKKEQDEYERAQTAKGLVQHGGEWMTPTERSRRIVAEKADKIIDTKAVEPDVPFKIVQALENGCLCSRLEWSRYFQRFMPTADIFFLYGAGNKFVADGDRFKGTLYWCGTFSYTTVQHVRSTVNSYAISRESAREIVIPKYSLEP